MADHTKASENRKKSWQRDGGKPSKPKWVIEKEKLRAESGDGRFWLFGIHAVRDALENPSRRKYHLMVTQNAANRLEESIDKARAQHGEFELEILDPRKFNPPIDKQSVHQGAVLQVDPLDWGDVSTLCAPRGATPLVILLDRVSDPHNVGAILRSAEVFGARAVIATQRHAAPETGALAKTASGALERQPYLRVPNLGNAMEALREMGYFLMGLDGEGEKNIGEMATSLRSAPLALVLGAEGPGLREKTRELCHALVRIPYAAEFGSLNVSNAAAISLYAAVQGRGDQTPTPLEN